MSRHKAQQIMRVWNASSLTIITADMVIRINGTVNCIVDDITSLDIRWIMVTHISIMVRCESNWWMHPTCTDDLWWSCDPGRQIYKKSQSGLYGIRKVIGGYNAICNVCLSWTWSLFGNEDRTRSHWLLIMADASCKPTIGPHSWWWWWNTLVILALQVDW